MGSPWGIYKSEGDRSGHSGFTVLINPGFTVCGRKCVASCEILSSVPVWQMLISVI